MRTFARSEIWGRCLESGAATGAGGFIFIRDGIDPYDPGIFRATMGAIFKQKIVRARADQFQKWVKKHQLQVVGASPDGSVGNLAKLSARQPNRMPDARADSSVHTLIKTVREINFPAS